MKSKPITQSSPKSSTTRSIPPINSLSEEARRKAEEFASTATKVAASTAQEGIKSMKSFMVNPSTQLKSIPLSDGATENSKITSPQAQTLRKQIQKNYTRRAS